jgi:amidohydrolase
MDKEALKRFACDYLDAHAEERIQAGETLLRMPELAYCEQRTSDFVGRHFAQLGLAEKTGLAITGRRADVDTGRPGPRVAILGELDALIVPQHPFADATTHAAHACGHHAALNAMLGCAEVLTRPEVLSQLSGSLAFIATPSEECQNQPYIASLIEAGKLQLFGGKSELIAEGVFDDIDVAMMLHAGGTNYTPSGFNGFVMKRLVFHGKSAHAGANPDKGVNAISMMRSALALMDAQRDTFRDEAHVRLHGYITEGGEAVNVVPDRAVFTLQVRAASPEAIQDPSDKVDRCVKAVAIAFGGETEVQNIFGFMPLIAYDEFDDLHERNVHAIAPYAPFTRGIYRP